MPPSIDAIEAVAEHKGRDPLDLDQPLYETIDTDALDALVVGDGQATAGSDIAIEFAYEDCRVHLSSDGAIEVSSHGE